MPMTQSEKLKLIRKSECLKLREVAEISGISYSTYHCYESGRIKMSMEACIQLFKIPRFRKYRDWFMFDEMDPSTGQIAPALAHFGQEKETSSPTGKQTG